MSDFYGGGGDNSGGFNGNGGGFNGGNNGGFNGGGGGGFNGNNNSGGGGGGFVGGGGFTQSVTSPGGGDQKRLDRMKQTLLPVTIKQLNGATQDNPDDAFMLDGQPLHHIALVGCIVESKEQSTNLTYTLEDGTGRVEVKMWIDSEDTDYFATKRAEWQEGVYVRVIGNLRSFQDRRNVVAFDIRPVKDFNEVTHHMLEAIYVHLKATKQPQNAAQEQGQRAGMGIAAGGGNNGGNAGNFNNADFSGNDDSNGYSALQNTVMKLCKAGFNNEHGTDIRKVIEQLVPQGHSEQHIRAAAGFLADEGLMYSTIDENHYKSTSD